MKPALLMMALLAGCSDKPQSEPMSMAAHRQFNECVDANRQHLSEPSKTLPADAIAAVDKCERELRIAAYLQAKKRTGKGEYRTATEAEVYREWKVVIRDLALCRLSTALKSERCFTTD